MLFATALSVVAASGFYRASLEYFIANKTEEKATAMQLVDAFVSNYSRLRNDLGAAHAPVPATFRARSIELFNHERGEQHALRIRWIGREGKAIATPPSDPDMARTIESFVGQTDPQPASRLLTDRRRAGVSHGLPVDRPRGELRQLPQQPAARAVLGA